ncbi:hypothetical protein HYC85_022680 [Camellia sinensis]|uniref:Uncharacterized protein n=1 Tax=Camellia sinensis TaxID=4442 RepID=A0A7J7GEQ5_CAMSI|nr:hypothetical protein HYC85_022680 [Camellia sinensis]
MALFFELVATLIILVTKPISLVMVSCIFGVRSFCIVIHTWVELLRATIIFHVYLLWRLVICTFVLISLPVRVLTALQRERLLQMRLHELQIQLENLVWNRKELEERLQMSIKECRMMEAMLGELEDEHEEAIVKIELLESEDKKVENLQLKEIQDDTDEGHDHDNDVAHKYGISYGLQPLKSSFSGSGIIIQDLPTHKDACEDESKSKTESIDFMRTRLKASGPSHAVTPGITSRNIDMNEVLGQQREVALLQSLFSAVLSLLVGTIIWEAEDPCMPLVVALFTVVGMSLKSVVRFLYTIKNKPASDVVALLSLNCLYGKGLTTRAKFEFKLCCLI